ncbi:hypothetical protein ACRHM7_03520 [Chromohalobacter israelensis]|uniref:hypothetical protein n=1 Tax=Chromohalobacter israelensis TaxID=141390 RepID=UPI000D71C8BC|nr:hypothetical protein [Chromohalobacter salexigens]
MKSEHVERESVINGTYEDFMGFIPDERDRKPVSSVMTAECFKQIVPRFERDLSDERVNEGERLTLVDGRSLHVDVSYVPGYRLFEFQALGH